MIHSSVGYCPCGAEIWIEYLHSKGGWRVRLLDENNQPLENCPQCRRRLDEADLNSR